MKTLQELRDKVTEAKQAYDEAAKLPLRTTRSYVLTNRHRDIRLAQREYIAAQRRVQVRGYRREITNLKNGNLELSTQLSAESAEVQRLTARNRELINDASLVAVQSDRTAKLDESLAACVDDMQDGAKELRSMLQDAGCPADKRGLKNMVAWLIGERDTLRKVNEARAEAHVLSPETVEQLNRIAGSPGLSALWLSTDKLSLATLRGWWWSTTEEERRAQLYNVIADAIKEPSQRGMAWISVVRGLAQADVVVGVLPMEVGKTGTVDHIVQKGNNTVTVGNEQRGPEWGKGKAKEAFENLRAYNASIPRGKRVAHELQDSSLFLDDKKSAS